MIIKPRYQGKTTELIQMSASLGYCNYIICADHKRARMIDERAEELGLKIWFPITFEELRRGRFSRSNIKAFLLDDADDLLHLLTKGVPVLAATFTSEGD
jgi:hypothetical protein